MILLSVYKGTQDPNAIKTTDQDMLWQVSHENVYRHVMSCCFHGMACRVMSCYQRISYRALLYSKMVFHVCPQQFRSSNMSANSKAPYTADAQSTYQTALQSRTVHGLNDTAVTDKLFLDWMTIQLQTVHWPMQQPYLTSWT